MVDKNDWNYENNKDNKNICLITKVENEKIYYVFFDEEHTIKSSTIYLNSVFNYQSVELRER